MSTSASYAFDPEAPPTSVVDRGTTRDGIEQLRRRWPADPARAAVLIVHGIAEHSGRYEHVGRQLADAGLYTVAYDARGFGASGGHRAYVDRFTQYHDDVEDQLHELRGLGVPVVLVGHSMGGLVASSYVLAGRPAPDLLILSAPALSAETPAWMRMAVGPLAAVAPRLLIKAPIDGDALATDPRVGQAYEADPLVHLPTSTRLASELFATIPRTRELVDRLDIPTLVLHGSEDTLVPVASSEVLAGVPVVERRVIDGARHEVFNEPVGPAVVADMIDWIAEHS